MWPMQRRSGRVRMVSGVLATVALMVEAGACSTAHVDPGAVPVITPPPVDAPAAEVLDAYLAAFKANDCTTAAKLTVSTFAHGNGELCGDVAVDSFDGLTQPAVKGDEVTYAITLHVAKSSADGTVPSGRRGSGSTASTTTR